MRVLILTILSTLTLAIQAGDDLKFSWEQNKKQVGELTIVKNTTDDGTSYSYLSVMNFNTGIEMNVREAWQADYSKDHQLQSFQVENSFNGKSRVVITEKIEEDAIVRTVNGKEKVADRPLVDYSYILLFVQPPSGLVEVYSELYGLMFEVMAVGKDTYIITDSRNREYRFTYDDEGSLKKAEVEMTFGTFTLLPK